MRAIDEKVDFVSEFTGQNHEEIAIPQDPDQSPKRIVAVDGSKLGSAYSCLSF